MADRIFEAFIFKGRKFLAVTINGGVRIIADNGDSYGAFPTIEAFKKSQDWGAYPGYNWERMRLGPARLSVQPL